MLKILFVAVSLCLGALAVNGTKQIMNKATHVMELPQR